MSSRDIARVINQYILILNFRRYFNQHYGAKVNKKGKEDENISGQRQSIELVLAKGSKYLTKEKEIEERKSSEVKPITDDISPPPYISTKKKKTESGV